MIHCQEIFGMEMSQENGTMGTDDLDLQVVSLLCEYGTEFGLHTTFMERK